MNLLLITIDTLRTDRLSCYVPDHVKTPSIDSLAAKSTVFTKAFAHTSTTLPSHTNILLGMTPVFHGVHENTNFKVRNEYLTIAELLKEHGYSTAAFVGALPLDSIYGLSQGFDIYDDDFGSTADGKRAKEVPAEVVIEKTLQYLEGARPPWFVWLHCYDPHDPYEPPEPFKTEYKTEPYDGEVAYVDFALKRLFRFLESKDLFERTMIVFTGDHGESLGEHGERTHGFLAYNSAIAIPLIIYVPETKARIVHQSVSHIDLFPTICEALEIKKPSFLQGSSLIPLQRGKKIERRVIYFESLLPFYTMGWAPIRGIISDKFKFIDSPIPELYDLEKDFSEIKDLSREKKLDVFEKQLAQFLQSHGSGEEGKTKRSPGLDDLEMLRSLGYIGDYAEKTKKNFGPEDDVKALLPYYNKSQDAIDLFYKEGKVKPAVEMLKEIITESKRFPFAFMNLAMIYKDQERLGDAIQVLNLGLENIPGSFGLFMNLIEYLFEANQWNEMIALYQKMPFDRFEFDPDLWNLVATAYANIGDFENALLCCERAVSIDQTDPISYVNLGRIHYAVFNVSTNPEVLEKALLNYQKALFLDPGISAAHNGLGVIFMYKQNYDSAVYHLELALKLQPDLESVLYNLGLAYLKIENKEKALLFFTRFKTTRAYLYLSSSDKEKLEDLILKCREHQLPK